MVVENQRLAGDANDQDRLMALLAYLIGWIVSLIVLATDMKDRPFARFHAVNALAFDIVWYIIWVVLCVVCTIAAAFTFGLGYICLFIPFILWLVLKIWYGVLAYQGNYFDIPLLTRFCRDQRWL